MAFDPMLSDAARRNLQAADYLEADRQRDVAGYLYGIAAECAVKHMVTRMAIPPEHDKNGILYEHFPGLLSRLRDALQGRNLNTPLGRLIRWDGFMNNWHVSMRYAGKQRIHPKWIDAWQQHAKDAVNSMDT